MLLCVPINIFSSCASGSLFIVGALFAWLFVDGVVVTGFIVKGRDCLCK
jgi:hypothetical protein